MSTVFRVRGSSSTLRGGATLRSSLMPAIGPEVPSSRLILDPTLFRRERPILSGQNDLDRQYGMRGIAASQNHGWSYRVRIINSWWDPEDGEVLEDTASAGTQTATYQIPWQWAKGVTTMTADVWIKNCKVAARAYSTSEVDGSWSAEAGAALTRAQVEVTLDGQTGLYGYAQIIYVRKAGQTAQIYGWEIAERTLTPAEIT